MVRKDAQRGRVVQTELESLQRKFRMMEATRKACNDDSVQTIRMQRQKIVKLKRDNDRLKEELAVETRQAKAASSTTSAAQISRLQDQADMYSRKIENEKRRIDEMDKQIEKIQENILQQRREMGGVNASRDNNKAIQKQIRMLENRLDKALVKFNEALGYNKKLRETIDNLRRERVVFDGIYKKLERELEEKKNEMAQIIEISNVAYEARDQARNEMMALKNAADQEQSQFEHEWSELGELIEEDRKRQDTLKSGGDTEGQSDGKPGTSGGELVTADDAVEEEQELRKRLSRAAWSIVKNKANIHVSQEKVKSYEEAFDKIRKATGIDDIDTLVETFVKAEDENFALFNKVNDLGSEIETLEEEIRKLDQQVEEQKNDTQKKGTDEDDDETSPGGEGVGETAEQHQQERQSILEDLEEKLQKTNQKTGLYEHKYTEAMQTVTSLHGGIEKILRTLEVDESALQMLELGSVTEANMMQYLSIIERGTNKLLSDYTNQASTMGDEDETALAFATVEASQLHQLDQVAIVPPSAADTRGDEDAESEDER